MKDSYSDVFYFTTWHIYTRSHQPPTQNLIPKPKERPWPAREEYT